MEKYSTKEFIEGWFLNAELDSIRVENVHSWLSWILYGGHVYDLTSDEKEKVVSFRENMCETLGITFKEGFNPNVKHCRFSLEPIRTIHHPLTEYVLVNIFEGPALASLYMEGFRRYQTSGGIYFWYKKNNNRGKGTKKPPLLFLHGICTGWSSYIEGILKFGKDRDVILIDYRCVRTSWIDLHVPNQEEIGECIQEILEQLEMKKVSLLVHSWGVFLTTWLLKKYPTLFVHITFIDPVGLVVFLPDPTYTLMYKPPVTLRDYATCYLVRNNINTANSMYRNLLWCNVVCFLDDIPKHIPVLIGSGSEDDLVPIRALQELVDLANKKRSAEEESITLLTFDKYKHGDIFSNTEAIDKLVHLHF